MCINTVYNYIKNSTKSQKIIARKDSMATVHIGVHVDYLVCLSSLYDLTFNELVANSIKESN